jgi:hypothetical protein
MLLPVLVCVIMFNLCWLAVAAGLLSMLPFIALHCYVYSRPTPQLAVRYDATWAIVTGSSSGVHQAQHSSALLRCVARSVQFLYAASSIPFRDRPLSGVRSSKARPKLGAGGPT